MGRAAAPPWKGLNGFEREESSVSVGTSNTQTVEQIYESFGGGDVAAILEQLAEDVAWEHWDGGNSAQDAGLPWLARRTGRAEVAEFFATAASELEFHSFRPVEMLEGDGTVAAVVRVDVSVTSTGRRIEDDEIHLWTFDDAGKVSALRHFVDTGKHLAAAGR
jgi:ketosteroid isomerase-like protein